MVLLGAALGAPARYLVDRWVQGRHDSVFPWGTLAVNVAGSLLLGLVLGLAAGGVLPAWVVPAVGTGFCGALTTYSTFGYETVRLARDGSARYAVLNVGANLGAGLAAAWLGAAGASVLTG